MKFDKIEEMEGRVKSGFKYKVSLDGREYIIDLNHEIYLKNDGEVVFKRKVGWDYNRWSFSHTVIDFEIRSPDAIKIWDELNSIFKRQQEGWREETKAKNSEV